MTDTETLTKVHNIMNHTEELLGKILGKEIRLRISERIQFKMTPHNILFIVTEHTGLSPDQVKSHSRKHEIVMARTAAVQIIKDQFPAITEEAQAEIFGGRDHSTINTTYNRHKEWMESDYKPYKELYNQVRDSVLKEHENIIINGITNRS